MGPLGAAAAARRLQGLVQFTSGGDEGSAKSFVWVWKESTAVWCASELDMDIEKGNQINTFPSYKTTIVYCGVIVTALWSGIQ